MMDYKERLREFNSTEKYFIESDFLVNIMNLEDPYFNRGTVLDYGCGRGDLAYSIFADGFDINNYKEADIDYYLNELPVKVYKHIYFMHSLAHIPNITEVLKDLKQRYNATVTVITPNRHWLMMQSNINYTPDPTVVRHYTMTELKELFVSCGYEVTLCGQFGDESSGINERIFLQAK